jgi:hypothetical protein
VHLVQYFITRFVSLLLAGFRAKKNSGKPASVDNLVLASLATQGVDAYAD